MESLRDIAIAGLSDLADIRVGQEIKVSHNDIAAIQIARSNLLAIHLCGEELVKFRGGIKDEKVLTGFNMALAIANKWFGDTKE